jgi:hypothetical protein
VMAARSRHARHAFNTLRASTANAAWLLGTISVALTRWRHRARARPFRTWAELQRRGAEARRLLQRRALGGTFAAVVQWRAVAHASLAASNRRRAALHRWRGNVCALALVRWRHVLDSLALVVRAVAMWRHGALVRSPPLQPSPAPTLGSQCGSAEQLVACLRLPLCGQGRAARTWFAPDQRERLKLRAVLAWMNRALADAARRWRSASERSTVSTTLPCAFSQLPPTLQLTLPLTLALTLPCTFAIDAELACSLLSARVYSGLVCSSRAASTVTSPTRSWGCGVGAHTPWRTLVRGAGCALCTIGSCCRRGWRGRRRSARCSPCVWRVRVGCAAPHVQCYACGARRRPNGPLHAMRGGR